MINYGVLFFARQVERKKIGRASGRSAFVFRDDRDVMLLPQPSGKNDVNDDVSNIMQFQHSFGRCKISPVKCGLKSAREMRKLHIIVPYFYFYLSDVAN